VSLPLEMGSGVQAGGGLPVVDQALEPEWVRHGSATTQKAYESALAFEQTLVEQLSQSLAATTGSDGEGSPEGEEGSSSAADSQLSSMLPQALSSGVMHAGGLGMAAQLTRQFETQSPSSPTDGGGVPPGGGTTAPAGGGSAAASSSGSGGAAA
jgi:hypothetical protein